MHHLRSAHPIYDPERDVAVYWCMGHLSSVWIKAWSLMNYVAEHFNGQTINRAL